MDIDAKNIKSCIWRILKIFMNFVVRFIQNHPYVSGLVSVFFFLYTFYPSVLRFLIYSSPVIVCTIVFFRNSLNSKHPPTLNLKENEKKNRGISGLVEDDVIVERNEGFYAHPQTGIRRNAKENDKVSDDLIARVVSIEEIPREIQIEKEGFRDAEKYRKPDEDRQHLDSDPSSSYLAVSRNGSDDWTHKFHGSAADLEALNMEEAEDEDEEEAQEDGNKAVEWTEADQKNLLDLGTSEIERNKRLESLIAKRRAKKLFSMQVQRNLIDLDGEPIAAPCQVAPILIARSNPFDLPCNPHEPEAVPIPGSAPSILLPMRNPFDIPYDPLEEKPILTGDSFQDEFLAAHKDMLFCRHESFSLGPSFPGDPKQDQHESNLNLLFAPERRAADGSSLSRFKRPSDDNIVEQISSSEGTDISQSESARDHDHVVQEGQVSEKVVNSMGANHERGEIYEDGMINLKREGKENEQDIQSRSADEREIHMRPGVVADNNGKKHEVPENLESRMGDFSRALNNSLQNSLTCPVPKIIAVELEDNGQRNEPYYDSSPSAIDKSRMEEDLFYEDRIPGHTPSFSIASDMQVEVSEGGSPPLTVGTVSPPDGDVDKEITSGSEEMWGASSHLAGIEENESSSRALHEISEQDIIGVGLSGIKNNSEGPIAPLLVKENAFEHATRSINSLSSPITELPEEVEAYSTDINQKIQKEIQQDVVEEIEESMSSSSSEELSNENLALPPEKAHNFTNKSVANPSNDSTSKNVEETFNTPKEFSGEGSIIDNVGYPVLPANRDADGEGQPLIMIKADKVQTETTHESSSKSTECIEKKNEEPKEHETTILESQPATKNDNSESNKVLAEDFEKLTQPESITDDSKSIEDKMKNLTPIQDGEAGQAAIEIGISGVNMNSDDTAVTIMQPEIVVEQIIFDSSSSPSPKSILPETVFLDQEPLSSFDHMIQVYVQQPNAEDNSLHEASPENLTSTIPHSPPQLLEEPSSSQEKYPEEAKIIDNANESLVHNNGGDGNSISVEDVEGESKNLNGQRPTSELPKPADEAHARSFKGTLDVYTYKTNIPLHMEHEEEFFTPKWYLERPNIIPSAKDIVTSDKYDIMISKNVKDDEGESQRSIKEEAVEEASNPPENVETQMLIKQEAAVEPQFKEVEKASSIPIDESQRSIKEEAVEEASNPPEKVETQILIKQEAAVEPQFKEVEKASPIPLPIDESQRSIEEEAVEDASNPPEKVETQILIKQEAAVEPHFKEVEKASSIPLPIDESQRSIKEEAVEDASNPPEKVETQILIKQEAAVEPQFKEVEKASSIPIDESQRSIKEEAVEDASNPPEKVETQILIKQDAAVEPQFKEVEKASSMPIDESNLVYSVNESAVDQIDTNGNHKSAADKQGKSSGGKPEFTEVTNTLSTEYIGGHTEKLTEDERILGPSNPVGESHDQNTNKDGKESKLSINHGDHIDSQVPSESKNISVVSEDVKVNPTN